MPNRSADPLFQLIHSLEKSEKRAFKLYIKRNSHTGDLKIVQLFDVLDKMKEYDDTLALKKIPSIKRQQLSNLKAHLYKELLSSLRLLKTEEDLDIQLHEQLDHARILYNKGLYLQSLKILDRIKHLALSFNQDSFLIRIISLEKKIETLHITRSMQNRADRLAAEADEVNVKRLVITRLSNLALQLYSWYIKNGHARNEKDEEGVKLFFKQQLPANAERLTGFYERLYLFQSYCWFAFIRQDFLMYYRYTQKWVDLFTEQKQMINIETGHYIKGMHNLLNAHFDLRNYIKFEQTLHEFEKFSRSDVVERSNNNLIKGSICTAHNFVRQEQYCSKGHSATYNGYEQDKATPTYGGYSKSIVVNEDFVLHVSDKLSLDAVAPLLCAGITTYSPLRYWKVGKGHKVAVAGLGGLGHMAVKFAVSFGAEVTVLSTSANKEADAKKLGAHKFVVTKNADELKSVTGYFDFIVDTISAPHDYASYLSLLKTNGVQICVGAPPTPAEVHVFNLIGGRKSLAGSLVGGLPETQEMLDYCAEHNIVSDIELINIKDIDASYERMLKGDVKYRFVIDMATL